MPFSDFSLCSPLQHAIKENGFITPTPIQEKVIPHILEQKDIMAQAQTGSGKTASYVLPLLELWNQNPPQGKSKIKALILTPTRELTLQVSDSFKVLGKHLHKQIKVVSIIGGQSIGDQLYDIQQGCDIVVATSGRLLDVLSKKQMNLSHLEFFILDEADKMLDLGFSDELDEILKVIPNQRQNLMFSATYPTKMLNIASRITQNAVEVKIQDETPTVQNIQQRAINVNKENKGPLLRHLLKTNQWEKVIVFMANKRAADNIAVKCRKHGFDCDSFHGDLFQEERIITLDAFKDKKINILFATDIASRGLDINDVQCVINFDLPRSTTDYIHRIGRTARAGKKGLAISFVGHEDQDHFKLIQKRCDISMHLEQIKGFELTGEAPAKIKGQEPTKGKRKSKKDKLREAANKKI